MNVLMMALQVGGLTLGDILTDIPHDAGAVLVFLLVGGLTFLVWFGSRRDVIERYGAGRIRPPPPKQKKSEAETRDPS